MMSMEILFDSRQSMCELLTEVKWESSYIQNNSINGWNIYIYIFSNILCFIILNILQAKIRAKPKPLLKVSRDQRAPLLHFNHWISIRTPKSRCDALPQIQQLDCDLCHSGHISQREATAATSILNVPGVREFCECVCVLLCLFMLLWMACESLNHLTRVLLIVFCRFFVSFLFVLACRSVFFVDNIFLFLL